MLILHKLHILCQCLPCYQALDKNLRYFVPLLDQCCMYSYNIRAPPHQLKIKYIRRVNVSVNKKLKTSPPLPVQQVLIFPHSRPHNAHLDPLGVLRAQFEDNQKSSSGNERVQADTNADLDIGKITSPRET